MACKISWTFRAWKTYEANIEYLLKHWTEREVKAFVLLVEEKLKNISVNPKLGRPKSKSIQNIRCTLIHKRVLLIYRYKSRKNEIELLVFWNTSQNPKKLRL